MSKETPFAPWRSKWSKYPHADFASIIDEVHADAARMEAWRAFTQPPILDRMHEAECHFINTPSRYNSDETHVEFPEDTTEEAARRVISQLVLPAHRQEGYEFLRAWLGDRRAWARLPLAWFVSTDPRAVPTVSFCVRKHWRLKLSDFSFGRRQEKHKHYDTLILKHPQLNRRCRDGEELVKIEIVKGTPVAERREALLLEAETHADEWMFSILEREVVRRLNGEPSKL